MLLERNCLAIQATGGKIRRMSKWIGLTQKRPFLRLDTRERCEMSWRHCSRSCRCYTGLTACSAKAFLTFQSSNETKIARLQSKIRGKPAIDCPGMFFMHSRPTRFATGQPRSIRPVNAGFFFPRLQSASRWILRSSDWLPFAGFRLLRVTTNVALYRPFLFLSGLIRRHFVASGGFSRLIHAGCSISLPALCISEIRCLHVYILTARPLH